MRESNFLAKYGSWAVVTGASDGIGCAFAEHLAAIGFHLVLVARRAERLNELSVRLKMLWKINIMVVSADLSSEEGLAALEDSTAGLDIGLLVTAAGFGTSGPLLMADLEKERTMLDLNCFAVLRQCIVFGQRTSASD